VVTISHCNTMTAIVTPIACAARMMMSLRGRMIFSSYNPAASGAHKLTPGKVSEIHPDDVNRANAQPWPT
jgi:hypothetical protein